MGAVVALVTSDYKLLLGMLQLIAPDRVEARPNQSLTTPTRCGFCRGAQAGAPRDSSGDRHGCQRERRMQRHLEPRHAGGVRRHRADDLVLAVAGEVPDREVEG